MSNNLLLTELIKSLSKAELDLAKNYLTSFTKKNDENKSISLLNLILNSEEPVTDEQCSLAIYGELKSNKYEKLKSRLKQKILDSLTLEVSLERNNSIDEVDLVNIKLKKRIAQFHYLSVLKSKGPFMVRLIEDLIHLSKKYERYNLLSDVLFYKQQLIGLSLNKEDYESLSSEINENTINYNLTILAFQNYQKSFSSKVSDFNNFKEYFDFQFSLAKELNEKNKNVKSSWVRYFELVILGKIHLENKDLSKSFGCYELIKKLLLESKAINKKQRVGNNFLRMAELSFMLKNYTESIEFLKKAQGFFNPNSPNQLIIQFIRYYPNFELKNFHECLNLSESLLSSKISIPGTMHKSRFPFLLALAQFKMGNFKETVKILIQSKNVFDDHYGWDISARVLLIQGHLELENFDHSYSVIEALRKYIERGQKTFQVHKRNQMIYKILNSLAQNSFDYKKTWRDQAENFKLLEAKEGDYQWEPLSFEIMQFQDWFKEKIQA